MLCPLTQTQRHTDRRKAQLLEERAKLLEQAQAAGFDIDPNATFELAQQGSGILA